MGRTIPAHLRSHGASPSLGQILVAGGRTGTFSVVADDGDVLGDFRVITAEDIEEWRPSIQLCADDAPPGDTDGPISLRRHRCLHSTPQFDVRLLGIYGGNPICLDTNERTSKPARQAEVQSLTPEICEALRYRSRNMRIEVHQPGICQIEAHLDDGNSVYLEYEFVE